MKKFWRVWKFAIGSFSDEQTKEYDNVVAITRTFIVESAKIINVKSLQQKYDPEETIAFSGEAIPDNDLEVIVEDPTVPKPAITML